MIGTKSYKSSTEFNFYFGMILFVMGMYVSRPKNKSKIITNTQSNSNDDTNNNELQHININDAKYYLITFIITSLIYIEILIFAICMLSLKLYKDDTEFRLYAGLIANLTGIYVSRPKYSNKK